MPKDYEVRAAKKEDLDALRRLFSQARARVGALGIDQWQDGYPNDAQLLCDIKDGQGLVFLRGGAVQGYCMVSFEKEDAYDQIDGQWQGASTDAVVVHRVAVSDASVGTGLGGAMMREAEKRATAGGRHFVRIDTHRGNRVMRAFLEHLGYQRRGEVTYARIAGDPVRVCYEKRVTSKDKCV